MVARVVAVLMLVGMVLCGCGPLAQLATGAALVGMASQAQSMPEPAK